MQVEACGIQEVKEEAKMSILLEVGQDASSNCIFFLCQLCVLAWLAGSIMAVLVANEEQMLDMLAVALRK